MYKQKKFKIINRIISYFLIFSTLFIFSIYIIFFSNIVMPWEKNEIIKTTLDWGGLNKLPENSKIIEIEKRGSMFTRQFIIEFESSNSDINSWIEKNEKLKKITPKIENQKKIYDIHPGENGALGGSVEIDNNIVKVNMSWS